MTNTSITNERPIQQQETLRLQLNIKAKNDNYFLELIGVCAIFATAIGAYHWVVNLPDWGGMAFLFLLFAPSYAARLKLKEFQSAMSFLVKDDCQMEIQYFEKKRKFKRARQIGVVENIEKLANGVKITFKQDDVLHSRVLLNEDYNGEVLQLLVEFFHNNAYYDLPVEANKLQLVDTYRYTLDAPELEGRPKVKIAHFVHHRPKFPFTTSAVVLYFGYLIYLMTV